MNTVYQPLRNEEWTPVSFDAVVLSFLRAEWDKPTIMVITQFVHRTLIDSPDLTDRAQNALRASVLWAFRGALLQHIPVDTQWFQVRFLREHHFMELRAISHPEWNSRADRNELPQVAARKPIPLRDVDVTLWEPILWGLSKDAPFSILEGNNRLTAYAGASNPPPLECVAYVGVSPSKCFWHLEDGMQ